MGDSLGFSSFGEADPFTGAFHLGTGATRPALQDVFLDLKNVGGISSKVSGKNNLKIRSSAERKALVEALSQSFAGTAGELELIRPQLEPGFSDFRKAGLARFEVNRLRAVGNLKENLARRRVLGSSFANDQISRLRLGFAQDEAEFEAQTTLQEIDAFTEITERIGALRAQTVQTKITELNLQLQVGMALQNKATEALTAVNLQQQRNAAQFSDNVFQAAGTAAGAACTIAREVYGVSNPKWLEFRRWLFREAPVSVFRWYLANQYRVAAWLSDKPRIKRVVRFFMDRVIEGNR